MGIRLRWRLLLAPHRYQALEPTANTAMLASGSPSKEASRKVPQRGVSRLYAPGSSRRYGRQSPVPCACLVHQLLEQGQFMGREFPPPLRPCARPAGYCSAICFSSAARIASPSARRSTTTVLRGWIVWGLGWKPAAARRWRLTVVSGRSGSIFSANAPSCRAAARARAMTASVQRLRQTSPQAGLWECRPAPAPCAYGRESARRPRRHRGPPPQEDTSAPASRSDISRPPIRWSARDGRPHGRRRSRSNLRLDLSLPPAREVLVSF